MSAIRTNAAAEMLGVSPNTLRSWERRFSYPSPRRSAGGHRQFELTEIEALRSAFTQTNNISSAISIARERGTGVGSTDGLRGALMAFDHERADRLLEESLAVRSVERTVACTLLPAVAALSAREGERQGIDARACHPSTALPGATRLAGWRLPSAWRLRPRASRACSSSTPVRR